MILLIRIKNLKPLTNIDCGSVERLSNGMIQVIYKRGYQVQLKDAVAVEEAIIGLAPDPDLYLTTIGVDGPHLFTDEALDYLATKADITKRIKGSAIVLNTLPNRLLARIFMQFHKPKYPTKVFGSVEDSIIWLNSLK